MSLADPDAQQARRRVSEVRRLAVGRVEGMLVQRSLRLSSPAAQSRARMTRRKASTSRVGIS